MYLRGALGCSLWVCGSASNAIERKYLLSPLTNFVKDNVGRLVHLRTRLDVLETIAATEFRNVIHRAHLTSQSIKPVRS